MKILTAAVAVVLLLAEPRSFAQVHETLEVRIHNVDVVVTDAAGNPVRGLRREDFEIREDGVAQTITNFAAYEAREAEAEAAEPAPAATAAPRAAAPPPPRTFVFFIDELSLDPRRASTLSAELTRFIDETLRDGDRAAIVQPARITNVTLDLTSDRELVRQQILDALDESAMKAEPAGFERDMAAFEREIRNLSDDETAEARAVSRRYARRATDRVQQRLGILRSVVASLAPQPGRKIVVTVTQNLSAKPGREFFERFMDRGRSRSAQRGVPPPPVGEEQPVDAMPPSMLDHSERIERNLADLTPAFVDLARLASANGVTLYALRPENDMSLRSVSMEYTSAPVDDRGAPAEWPDIGRGTALQFAIENTTAAIAPLVDITGGRHFRPSDDLGASLDRIAGDATTYYSLAYRARGRFDKAQKIEVRLRNRPDLQVRARSEVLRKSPVPELTDSVAAALVAPDAAANLLGIAALEPEGARGPRTIVVEVRIPMAALQFQKEGKLHRARYTAHYAAAGRTHDFVSGTHAEQLIEVPEEEWESAQTKHWTHVFTFERRSNEAYRVAVGIMDARSRVSGIAVVDVEEKSGGE